MRKSLFGVSVAIPRKQFPIISIRETKHVHIDYVQEIQPYCYFYRRRPWQVKEK